MKIGVRLSGGPSQSLTRVPDCLTLPNQAKPLNPIPRLRWQLPEPALLDLQAYNWRAETVRALAADKHEDGYHNVVQDGLDCNSRQVPSGVYVILLHAGNLRMSSKIFKIHSRGQRLQHVKCIAFLLF